MKKTLSLILILFSLIFTSCTVGQAQVSYDYYSYYDYENPSVTVVYRGTIPYYHMWNPTLNRWTYVIVPRERIQFIRRGYRPIQRHYVPSRPIPYNHRYVQPQRPQIQRVQPNIRQPQGNQPNRVHGGGRR